MYYTSCQEILIGTLLLLLEVEIERNYIEPKDNMT